MDKSFAAFVAANVLLPAAAIAQPSAPARLMDVVLKPGVLSEANGGAVQVTIKLSGMDVPAGGAIVALPDMAPNMPSAQPRTDVSVRDAEGEVELTTPAEKAGSRPWTSTRRVHGDVTIGYTLPIDNARGSGPPINLRIDGQSFSTPGRMLLALPPGETPYRIKIAWDLSAMGQGAVGITGFGDGDLTLEPRPASQLSSTMFAAGRFTREPAITTEGFSALWGGEPPFDPRPLMQWTGRLHAWMSKFFQDEVTAPYRVILRSNPQNPGGGVAMTQSFAVGYGRGTDPEALKSILGHEMTHTWTANETLGKWYSEGNAVYYQGLLPWRAGAISTEQFLANLNKTASRYYTNTMKHTPEDQVLDKFWDDTRIRVLPYDRGAMYFALLNAKVVEASNGERSIDDLIRRMIVLKREDFPITLETWLDLLRAEIGDEGPRIHQAMMAGELMLPPSNAFGPCFARTTKKIRIFEIGFDMASTVGPNKIVRGLKAGSEAAKAGVRDGDRIISGGAGDSVQADVNQPITLKLERAGQPLSVTYLPRGEAVDAYQWQRVTGVFDSACK